MVGRVNSTLWSLRARAAAMLLAGFVLAAATVALYAGSSPLDATMSAIRESGSAAPVVSIVAMTLHGLVPIPVEAVSAVNGAVFGLWGGAALTWTGMMLAAWLGYGVGRLFGGFVLKAVPAPRIEKISAAVGRGSWWKLLLARQMPFVSFWAMNLVMGFTKSPFTRFTWTTAVGNIPYVIVISLIASSLT